jgi:hypothetical protein
MPMLTDDTQERLLSLLVNEGLVTQHDIDTVKEEAKKAGKPVLTELVAREIIPRIVRYC